VLEQLEGYPAPADVWEPEILSERVTEYSKSSLEKLMSAEKVFAMGAGNGKVRLVQRGHGWLFAMDPEEMSPSAERLTQFLEEQGASFFEDFRESLDLPLSALVDSLAELFWSGVVTNDVFGEVSRLRRVAFADEDAILDRSQKMRKFLRTWKNLPGWTGRWSLIRSKGYLGKPGTPVDRVDEIVRIVLGR
jgi:ATP-dependent Lhr-like helicase